MGNAEALQSDLGSRLNSGRNLDSLVAIQRWNLNGCSQYGLAEKDRTLHNDIIILSSKDRVSCYLDRQKKVSWWSTIATAYRLCLGYGVSRRWQFRQVSLPTSLRGFPPA